MNCPLAIDTRTATLNKALLREMAGGGLWEGRGGEGRGREVGGGVGGRGQIPLGVFQMSMHLTSKPMR